jgi:hypothetical protein
LTRMRQSVCGAAGMRSGRNALLMGWIVPPPHCA